jgi:hypothetical protein
MMRRRLLVLWLLAMPGIQIVRHAGDAFVVRFRNLERRVRGLESFLATLNTTGYGPGGNITTGSTGYVASSPATTITVTVVPSGLVVVTGSANVGIDTGATASAGLYENGSLLVDPFVWLENNTGGGMTVSSSQTIVRSGLTPGSYVYSLKFKTSSGAISATFGNPVIVAEPV